MLRIKSHEVFFCGNGENGVAPGPILTPLQLDDGQPEDKISEFGQNTLLERAGQLAELALV